MSSISRLARAPAFVALLCALASCGRPASTTDAVSPRSASGDAPVALPGDSIYALDLPLTDSHGQRLHLADLRGQTMVAAMMYTSCDAVCPRVTEDMKVIEHELDERDRRAVTFALFSLDPGRDTPAALTRFATDHALDPSRWRLFAMPEDGVRELAAVIGVRYKPEGRGDIAHSAMIVVIDRQGVVRHRQIGLGEKPGELADALARARS